MSTSKTKEDLIKQINESSYFFDKIEDDELKKDLDIARAIITKSGSGGFDQIDSSFKTNKEILLLAYKNDSDGWNPNASKENYVPEEFINDVEIVSAAVKAGWSLDKVPEALKEDKNIIMAGVQNDSRSYEKLSDEQKNDEEILLAAMESKKSEFYTPFQFASDELKSNKELILKVLSHNGNSLEYVQDALKKDKEIVLEAAKQNGYSLQYADESFRQDREVVLCAARNGASDYIDSSFKKDQEICLSLIKENARSIFWCDDSLKKDKAFMIKAIEQNKFVTLEETSLNSEPEIDSLIKQGKAITKLYCEDLFGVIKSMVPEAEYLCFHWTGGNDSFDGYKLKAVKYPNQQVNEQALDENLIKVIEEIMYYSGVFEELELEVGWAGAFSGRGGLVLALQPLKERFQWQIGTNAHHDEYNEIVEDPYEDVVCSINLRKGYQGLSISGEGSEEVTDYDNVGEDEDVEAQYDTNYFDRKVPVGD